MEIEDSGDSTLFPNQSYHHKNMIYCEATPVEWSCAEIDISERGAIGINADAPVIKDVPTFEF